MNLNAPLKLLKQTLTTFPIFIHQNFEEHFILTSFVTSVFTRLYRKKMHLHQEQCNANNKYSTIERALRATLNIICLEGDLNP